jgi:hypothetical protein
MRLNNRVKALLELGSRFTPNSAACTGSDPAKNNPWLNRLPPASTVNPNRKTFA